MEEKVVRLINLYFGGGVANGQFLSFLGGLSHAPAVYIPAKFERESRAKASFNRASERWKAY